MVDDDSDDDITMMMMTDFGSSQYKHIAQILLIGFNMLNIAPLLCLLPITLYPLTLLSVDLLSFPL